MTIIAVSHTHIAADGMKIWGNEIRGLDHKKLAIAPDPRHAGSKIICAIAGLAPMQTPLIKWYQEGADPDAVPSAARGDDSGWTFVVIDRAGLWKYSNNCPYPEEFHPPFAMGYGIDMAHAAMWCGKSAEQAVRLVCEKTHTAGGEIQVIDIMEVTGFTLRQPVGDTIDKAAYAAAREQAERMRPMRGILG
jgi:hypothetical protein